MPFVSIFTDTTLFFPIQEEFVSCLSFDPMANNNLIQWLPCTVLHQGQLLFVHVTVQCTCMSEMMRAGAGFFTPTNDLTLC